MLSCGAELEKERLQREKDAKNHGKYPRSPTGTVLRSGKALRWVVPLFLVPDVMWRRLSLCCNCRACVCV
jgi:hypothetical protein